MDLISVDCPSCGARLPPSPASGEYRCNYCGNGFRLDQAKKAQTQAGLAVDPHAIAAAILEAQRAQAAQQPHAYPQQVPTSWTQPGLRNPPPARSGGGLVVGLVVMVGISALVGTAVMFFVNGSAQQLLGLVTQENVLWDSAGGVPQVIQLDGATAVVGRTRAVGQNDELYCGVYDVTGKTLWRTESLGTYMAGYQSTFCGAVGDAMIVTTGTGKIEIHALADGALRKSINLSDVADYLCVPPSPEVSTKVWIHQLDERANLLDPVTGELTATPQPEWCFKSRYDAAKRLQGGGSWADADDEGAPEVEGLKVDFVVDSAGANPVSVALGHNEPGTKVPSAVAFDPVSKEVRWQQSIPSVSKATVRDADKYGAIAGDRFITTYGAGQEDWYITAFDLGTGTRVWETKLRPIFAVDSLDALVTSPTHAFLVRTSSVDIFDAATGKQTGTIGKETYD